MTARQIIDAIKDIIQDTSFTDQKVLDAVNAVIARVAGAVQLPALASHSTVATDGTDPLADPPDTTIDPFVDVPSNYHRGLHFATSVAASGPLKVYRSFNRFIKKYPMLDETGSPESVVIYGRKIYYQPTPQTPDTISLWYWAKPTSITTSAEDLAADVDVIPTEQHLSVLVHGGAAHCFKIIDEGMDAGGDTSFKKYWALMEAGIQELSDIYGPDDDEPDYVNDDEDL